ncbi:uncharacterized protein LOC101953705 [Chrysemys picta bellii]|uniref:uncharacterized protein LOC101953705 n=1 Tax=Chrysemys picta bellii TaxID=8478 RepID=UPI0032B297A6
MSFKLGTISSEVKMAIGRNFIEIWKKHFTLISTSLYSLILVVLEKIMESEFKCPEDLHLRHWYSSLYVIVPFLTMLILGIIFQTACLHPSCRANKCCYFDKKCKPCVCCTDKRECSSCCGIFLKAFFPALLWIVILLLDGRYADCLFKPFKENITGENTHQSTRVQISQILGLSIILAVVVIGFVYWCIKCCCKRGDRKQITVDEDESGILLEQKAHEYILKQKKKAICQLFKKHLNDEYLADPETISIPIDKEKISGIIDRVCNISREGSADQEGIAMVNTSPQETSNLLPQGTASPLRQGTSNPSPPEISDISSC